LNTELQYTLKQLIVKAFRKYDFDLTKKICVEELNGRPKKIFIASRTILI